MPDYKAAYFRLLSGISAAIEELQRAQCEAGEGLVSGDLPIFAPASSEESDGEQAACCGREQDREAPMWSAASPRRSLR